MCGFAASDSFVADDHSIRPLVTEILTDSYRLLDFSSGNKQSQIHHSFFILDSSLDLIHHCYKLINFEIIEKQSLVSQTSSYAVQSSYAIDY